MEKLFEVNGATSKYPLDLDLLDATGKENEYYLISGDVKEKITLSDMVNNQVQILSQEAVDKINEIENNNNQNSAQIGSSGYCAKISSSGDSAQIGSSGDSAQIGSSGYSTQIGSSGDYAKIEINGEKSIAFVNGINSILKAKKGTWISLAEYEIIDNKYTPCFALSAQIGNENYKDNNGKVLSEDEFYCLYNKQFHIVDLSDGIKTIVINSNNRLGLTLIKGKTFNNDDVCIIKNEIISAHGKDFTEAKEDFNFKLTQLKDEQEIIDKIKETHKVTREDYRTLTGACKFGVKEFCNRHNIKDNEKEVELSRVLEMLSDDDYGAMEFKKFFNN